MIEMYLEPAESEWFTLRNIGGRIGLKVDISHIEIRELPLGDAAVMACTMDDHRYTMFAGPLKDAIKEADDINRHYAIPVRAPSLKPPEVRLEVHRQVLVGIAWVTYTTEQRRYTNLSQAVVALALAGAKVEDVSIVTSGTLRRYMFLPNFDNPVYTRYWFALMDRLNPDMPAKTIYSDKGAYCPYCLSRHVLERATTAQCLDCLREGHHHESTDTDSHGKDSTVD